MKRFTIGQWMLLCIPVAIVARSLWFFVTPLLLWQFGRGYVVALTRAAEPFGVQAMQLSSGYPPIAEILGAATGSASCVLAVVFAVIGWVWLWFKSGGA